MKFTLPLILITLFVTTAFAQEKGDTKIIVKNELGAEDNYKGSISLFGS